jgi:hypothetical protein
VQPGYELIIERYHRSLKKVVLLLHYYSPSQLREAIADFVNYYNNQRYHESLDNMTPANVFLWIRKGGQNEAGENQAKNDDLTPPAELSSCQCIIKSSG